MDFASSALTVYINFNLQKHAIKLLYSECLSLVIGLCKCYSIRRNNESQHSWLSGTLIWLKAIRLPLMANISMWLVFIWCVFLFVHFKCSRTLINDTRSGIDETEKSIDHKELRAFFSLLSLSFSSSKNKTQLELEPCSFGIFIWYDTLFLLVCLCYWHYSVFKQRKTGWETFS